LSIHKIRKKREIALLLLRFSKGYIEIEIDVILYAIYFYPDREKN